MFDGSPRSSGAGVQPTGGVYLKVHGVSHYGRHRVARLPDQWGKMCAGVVLRTVGVLKAAEEAASD